MFVENDGSALLIIFYRHFQVEWELLDCIPQTSLECLEVPCCRRVSPRVREARIKSVFPLRSASYRMIAKGRKNFKTN